MNDEFRQLLTKADADAPPVRQDLAASVRKVVSRRRRVRRAVSAASMLLLVIGIVSVVKMHRPSAPPNSIAVLPVDVDVIRREIAELNSEARFHEQIAQAIEDSRSGDAQIDASRIKFSEPDVLMQLDQRRQVAAQLMLAHAEQLESDPRKHEEAAANYKKVLALFPDTLASRAASDRLRGAGI